ncbi:MAG: exodeoxyribonuclease VII large subunit [Planctomycetaceae bacterium]|nr:exodeoxyribonuclease VII large subunit [Planctomycetaceae bacterium]
MTTDNPLFNYEKTLKNLRAITAVPLPSAAAAPLSVTELTLQIQAVVEKRFDAVWVAGQVSGLKKHSSGHIYLSLKDDGAVLPAVIWKSSASKVRFKLNDGLEVVCRGRLNVYPPQGKYQFVITEIEPKGIGSLELAFRQLHDKLAAEGLFDAFRKKPLPFIPRRVAVITSPTGAAIQDFLRILQRRTRLVDVLIVPVHVQGETAAGEIADALRNVNEIADAEQIDCIAVIRGGGSVEDLWAFNEEVLVRAVAASALPVVSGVGHEIDTTLCDLAADVRTATPSEAAERIVREDSELQQDLLRIKQQLGNLLQQKRRWCLERLKSFQTQPVFQHPERLLENRRHQVDLCEERLDALINRRLESAHNRFGKAAAELEALSPLAVLHRGYTLTLTADGRRIQSVESVKQGEILRTIAAGGVIESKVLTAERGQR